MLVLNQLEAGVLNLVLGGPATEPRVQRHLRGLRAPYRHGVASALAAGNRATRPVIGEWSPGIMRSGAESRANHQG